MSFNWKTYKGSQPTAQTTGFEWKSYGGGQYQPIGVEEIPPKTIPKSAKQIQLEKQLVKQIINIPQHPGLLQRVGQYFGAGKPGLGTFGKQSIAVGESLYGGIVKSAANLLGVEKAGELGTTPEALKATQKSQQESKKTQLRRQLAASAELAWLIKGNKIVPKIKAPASSTVKGITKSLVTKPPLLKQAARTGLIFAPFGVTQELQEQKPTTKGAAIKSGESLLAGIGLHLGGAGVSKIVSKIVESFRKPTLPTTPYIQTLEKELGGKITPKPTPKPQIKPTPKPLEPLAEEARKYKSAEEFYRKLRKEQFDLLGKEIDIAKEKLKFWTPSYPEEVAKLTTKVKTRFNLITKFLGRFKTDKEFTDFYTQATKEAKKFIPAKEFSVGDYVRIRKTNENTAPTYYEGIFNGQGSVRLDNGKIISFSPTNDVMISKRVGGKIALPEVSKFDIISESKKYSNPKDFLYGVAPKLQNLSKYPDDILSTKNIESIAKHTNLSTKKIRDILTAYRYDDVPKISNIYTQATKEAKKFIPAKEFSVASLNEKTLQPDGSSYVVKFVKSKQTEKINVEKYIIDSKGESQFISATPLEKAQIKYQSNDPEIIADRTVNPFKDYNFQTEKYTQATKGVEKVIAKPEKLTLAPTKAVKPEEVAKEAQKLNLKTGLNLRTREIRYERPPILIGKTELKTLLKENPELKSNPTLTVTKNKELEFIGKSTEFRIKSEALQLQPENLKVGDKIRVNEEMIKKAGAKIQQMRVYEIMDELSKARMKVKAFVKLLQTAPSFEKLEQEGMKITKQVKQPLGAKLGIMPPRELGKLDKTAGQIVADAGKAIDLKDIGIAEGQQRMRYAFKGLRTGELEKLAEMQDKGQLTPEVVEQLPKQYQRAIKEGLQWFPKEIKKIAQEKFGVDTSKWGYTEQNYLHHLFFGDQILRVNGKAVKIGTVSEVALETESLLKKGVAPAEISIAPKFMQQNQPTTLLTQQGFWAFINKMGKKLEISGDDVLEEISGVIAIKPRKIFVGAFKPRSANLQGFEKDPRVIYSVLWNRIQRKLYLEPFAKKATKMVSKIETPWLKTAMEDYIQNVRGKFIDDAYVMGISTNKLSRFITMAQSNLKLGYNPSTAILNTLQPLQTAYQELGFNLFKGYWYRNTALGREVISKLKISAQKAKFATGQFGKEGITEPIYKPLGMFTKAEMRNREATGMGAYLKALSKKLPESEAIEYARAVVDATQFRYDIAGFPKIMGSPLGKVVMQFKPFVIQYLYNAKNILMGQSLGGLEKWDKIMFPTATSKINRAVGFLGTNFAIGGLRTIVSLGLPVTAGFVSYLAIKHPTVFQGALKYVGIDLSKRAGASPYDLAPQDWSDLLGPQAGDVERISKAIVKYEKTKDKKDLIQIARISPTAWNAYQMLVYEKESGIQPTYYERLLRGLGFEPARMSTIKEGEAFIKYFQPDQRTSVWGIPTKKAVQNIIYNLSREDYDPKKKEVIRVMLKEMDINPEDYPKYLEDRKERMKQSRPKKPKKKPKYAPLDKSVKSINPYKVVNIAKKVAGFLFRFYGNWQRLSEKWQQIPPDMKKRALNSALGIETAWAPAGVHNGRPLIQTPELIKAQKMAKEKYSTNPEMNKLIDKILYDPLFQGDLSTTGQFSTQEKITKKIGVPLFGPLMPKVNVPIGPTKIKEKEQGVITAGGISQYGTKNTIIHELLHQIRHNSSGVEHYNRNKAIEKFVNETPDVKNYWNKRKQYWGPLYFGNTPAWVTKTQQGKVIAKSKYTENELNELFSVLATEYIFYKSGKHKSEPIQLPKYLLKYYEPKLVPVTSSTYLNKLKNK